METEYVMFFSALTTSMVASESILWFMDTVCVLKGGAYA
jgi:hypothetical protein